MKNIRHRWYLSPLLALLFLSCGGCGDKDKGGSIATDSLAMDYTVLRILPHNTDAFTQGLVITDNKILESTGQKGTSWIAEVNPASGNHDKKVNLDPQYFGEGITVLNGKIYQLTWENKVGFIYDAETYEKIGEFKIPTAKNNEGWGITHDSKQLILSDGSEKLYFVDTTNFQVTRAVTVTGNGNKIRNLNELEYANGFVYANVWETNWIVKIDPANGKVVGRLDLTPLSAEIRSMAPNADYLNGIAYDANSDALLVTGKLWPRTYLLRVNKL